MKVLVSGGAGFIGQHVVRELLARGHEVRVMDSLRADVHAGRTWSRPPDIEIVEADVRDAGALDRALDGIGAVVHLAAKVGLGVDVRTCRIMRPPTTWAQPSCSLAWLGPI